MKINSLTLSALALSMVASSIARAGEISHPTCQIYLMKPAGMAIWGYYVNDLVSKGYTPIEKNEEEMSSLVQNGDLFGGVMLQITPKWMGTKMECVAQVQFSKVLDAKTATTTPFYNGEGSQTSFGKTPDCTNAVADALAKIPNCQKSDSSK